MESNSRKSDVWMKMDNTLKRIVGITINKRVVIWGMNYEGAFMSHLLRRFGIVVDAWIDDSLDSFFYPVVRSNELHRFSPGEYIILITGKKNSDIDNIIRKRGFSLNKNSFYVKHLFFDEKGDVNREVSYYDYLEQYYNVDIINRYEGIYVNQNNSAYSTGMRYAFIDLATELEIKNSDAFFDIGFGKGGIIVLADYLGIECVGGCEIDPYLYDVAKNNMDILGIDTKYVYNLDVKDVTEEFDEFNYFFCYNSVFEDSLKRLLLNLKDSCLRRKRKIFFVYIGPENDDTFLDESFKINCMIHTDYYYSTARVFEYE